ncbi:glutathione S-transferase family protein [Allorhizobium sp. BGMRC 0089]|uniref:glutathione S-transferase family protein n=1 Tax=Allorhizobium sonneratiae TaxID=2934936 RepID=UPI002033F8D6|nr:glutathione S-transferase family protein [Allorhizobium sonneratiae]MCM2292070.1 glutathione S-transferase family protein [Allorhizobium sonneratiae]
MAITLYSLAGADAARPFSPHCWKAVMALHHKGLAFTEKPVGFTEVPKLEGGYSKIVPILRDEDTLVADSFQIALYLEETYPYAPSLFGGEGGKAMARFVESYSQTTIHPLVTRIAICDIHAMLGPVDQAYFRESRENLLGRTLEEFAENRDQAIGDLVNALKPLRHMLNRQPFIGGDAPLFADYIVFGALQWLKVSSGSIFLPEDDPVAHWFERLLDLHEGVGRKVA